jgi:hypothetical protein
MQRDRLFDRLDAYPVFAELAVMEQLDRETRVFPVGHFDKAEAFRGARSLVGYDTAGGYCAIRPEQFSQSLLGKIAGQIENDQFHEAFGLPYGSKEVQTQRGLKATPPPMDGMVSAKLVRAGI